MTNQEQLEQAFRKSLPLEGEIDFTTLAYGKTAGWDSIAHMGLVTMIEETFDVMIETVDVIAWSDYSTVRATLVERYGIDFDA